MRYSRGMRSFVPLAVAALLVPVWRTPVRAATPHDNLDAYALVARSTLRARSLRVTRGDVGVVAGALRSSGGLTAPDTQLVASQVRLAGASTCAAVFSDDAAGGGTDCAVTGAGVADLFADLAEECGLPSTPIACDPSAPSIRVTDGARSLPPGVYGDVSVSPSRGVLDLTGGSYTFCSLRIARGATVRVHAASEVRVVDSLLVNGALGAAPGVAISSTDLRVQVFGSTVRATRGAVIDAMLCAPNAQVSLRDTTVAGRIVGTRIKAMRSTVTAPYTEARARCDGRNRLRNVYFGDLHVHTTLSFDAYAYDVRTTPASAYQFALGAPVQLPPLDINGIGTQTLQIDRPLDFAAVTDHSEFLGEVRMCRTPGGLNYDSGTCTAYRTGGNGGTTAIAGVIAFPNPQRHPDICGADGQGCYPTTQLVWDEVQNAAADVYDRSAACDFTSLVGYEYTASKNVSTLHRNVLFRNDHVPLPTTVFEADTREELWAALNTTCRDTAAGCDALAIPHNSNESNGTMFLPDNPFVNPSGQRAAAALRGSMEPLAEIYQHKGDSECSNGLSGIVGAVDEQCNFEKRRRTFPDCGDGTGTLGTITAGCVSRRDFLRGAWLEGMKEQQRLGVDPFHVGVIASTDSHNGTPGAVTDATFIGHRGTDDATPASRLGEGDFYPGGYRYSPGGLAAVWAEENSRPALFDALRRRETYGTSGPRIAVRFFGGWNLPSGLCADPAMVEKAYATAVPMGSTLTTLSGGATAPSFLISALRDAGTVARPGTPLQRIQVIKLWLDHGVSHQQVFDVAGDPNNGAGVDESTCVQSGSGADSLCTVWTDPAFDASQSALYYVRVLENPSCRWNAYQCNALAPADRPPSCTDPNVPRTLQERAWTSPIWFTPAS